MKNLKALNERHATLTKEAETLSAVPPDQLSDDQFGRVKAIPGEIEAVETEIEEAKAELEEVREQQEVARRAAASAKAFREEPAHNGHRGPHGGGRLVTGQDGSDARARAAARAKARQGGEHDDEFDDPDDLDDEVRAGRAISVKAIESLMFGAHGAPSVGEVLLRDSAFKAAVAANAFEEIRGVSGGYVRFTLKGRNVERAVKAVMMTSNGFLPERQRIGVVAELPFRVASIQQYIPAQTTSAAEIEWMAQTTRTNAAAVVPEGAQKPEAARVYTPKSVKPKVIAEWQPVTEQQLADVPQLRSMIDMQMMEEVKNKEESEIISGAGGDVGLTGLLTRPGRLTASQAGGETIAEAIEKAAVAMRLTARLRPNVVVLHHNNLFALTTEKDQNDQYLLGHPLLRRNDMWKYTIVENDAVPEDTALVLDTTRFIRWVRDEVNVTIGWINDDFIRNQFTIRCELRVALAVYREDAISEVTLS